MRKRLIYGSGVLLLAILLTLIVWQGSFDFGDYAPSSPEQTYAFWAVSTFIFLLTVVLGFMLVRNFARLWVERRSDQEGSRIRSRLVLGALALGSVPVFFSVLFNIYVMNRTLEKWFSRPAENIKMDFIAISGAIAREHLEKAQSQADLIAGSDAVRNDLITGTQTHRTDYCQTHGIYSLQINPSEGPMLQLCNRSAQPQVRTVTARSRLPDGSEVVLVSELPIDLDTVRSTIDHEVSSYDSLRTGRKSVRSNYLQLLSLITLFILFFGTWIAMFLAKQISQPISALLSGANEVRGGNLSHRVRIPAIDELASLVRAFNAMTADLESSRSELESRRRFTEAILESIPTGVISLSADTRIQLYNRALRGLFPDKLDGAQRLDDLFNQEDAREIRYLMNRARRVGLAATQLELRQPDGKTIDLSATVAALDDRLGSGFVLVLEDTSDLLRAQKFAAWHEIARRIAHEIKNPLTPIALCAERITRQLDRRADHPGTDAILRECSAIIVSEVESLKTLVDEFSQFARFPAAQPVPSQLNDVVEGALAVFQERLSDIDIRKKLALNLPPVNLDRDQFKRLVVNLVDNAAEAMQGSTVKRLYITTALAGPDTVELVIADTGCGITPEDKEKLFLPYFSTKGRGTGLGLAIVNHIVGDHGAHIRVEDNQPSGARFVVEIPALTVAEVTPRTPIETQA